MRVDISSRGGAYICACWWMLIMRRLAETKFYRHCIMLSRGRLSGVLGDSLFPHPLFSLFSKIRREMVDPRTVYKKLRIQHNVVLFADQMEI